MSKLGIGPKINLFSVIYGTMILVLDFTYFSTSRFILIDRWVNFILGSILISIGLYIWIISVFMVDKVFQANKLCTTGIYSFMRHPVYGAWISFIVPGIVIFMGSYLGITIPVFMYIIFKLFIPQEEKELKKNSERSMKSIKKMLVEFFRIYFKKMKEYL